MSPVSSYEVRPKNTGTDCDEVHAVSKYVTKEKKDA